MAFTRDWSAHDSLTADWISLTLCATATQQIKLFRCACARRSDALITQGANVSDCGQTDCDVGKVKIPATSSRQVMTKAVMQATLRARTKTHARIGSSVNPLQIVSPLRSKSNAIRTQMGSPPPLQLLIIIVSSVPSEWYRFPHGSAWHEGPSRREPRRHRDSTIILCTSAQSALKIVVDREPQSGQTYRRFRVPGGRSLSYNRQKSVCASVLIQLLVSPVSFVQTLNECVASEVQFHLCAHVALRHKGASNRTSNSKTHLCNECMSFLCM